MSLLTFLLVVWVTSPNGEVNRFIPDSQLSIDDCELSAQSVQIDNATTEYACIVDLSAPYVEPFTLLVDPSPRAGEL